MISHFYKTYAFKINHGDSSILTDANINAMNILKTEHNGPHDYEFAVSK